jgi:repressor LexA
MMVRKSQGLGDRHRRILEFIEAYQRKQKHPPSIREIGESCGISSTSVVNYYLDQLEKSGHIERDRKISRGVRLSGQSPLGDMLRVPVLGRIVAGEPMPVPESDFNYFSAEDSVDIAVSLMPAKERGNRELFALEVEGTSMVDAMVNDGDIIVMKAAHEAKNGDMVAVWLPEKNETTLKYYYKEKDRFRLQPANPTMKPIYIEKTDPLEIRKVVMVIRRCRL